MSDERDKRISALEAEAAELKKTIAQMQQQLDLNAAKGTTLYASPLSAQITNEEVQEIPPDGLPARFIKEFIESMHLCDFQPRLNTSSYVNVVSEPEERDVALMGAEVNLADGSVYPVSVKLHDKVVNLIAKLWHAPEPPNGQDYCGAGTVGSTEACLLAGKCMAHNRKQSTCTLNPRTLNTPFSSLVLLC